MTKLIVSLLLFVFIAQTGLSQNKIWDETPEQKTERLSWWTDARFGMFIHWGLYAIPAGEWKGKKVPGIGEWIMDRANIPVEQYEPLAGKFNPQKFDAAQWVSIAKNAGMKYMVLTNG